MLFELGQYESALPILEGALRYVSPADGSDVAVTDLRSKVAWAPYHWGRYRHAVPVFQRALQTTPERPQLLAGIGWCYLQLGQQTEARRASERALALQPRYQDAVEGLRRMES